jgi:hypothetical protein
LRLSLGLWLAQRTVHIESSCSAEKDLTMSSLMKDALVTLDVGVLYDEDEDEAVRPMTFTASELGGLVGCVIELVNKFREGHDVANTIVALDETLQMLENEDDILSPPSNGSGVGSASPAP